MNELEKLSKRVHDANQKWWRDLNTGKPIKRNFFELLMLTVTELAEAMEGARKDLMDDHLPHRKMEEVEMADCYIRLLDIAGASSMPILDDEGIAKMGESMNQELPNFDKGSNKGECLLAIVTSVVGIANMYAVNEMGRAVSMLSLTLWHIRDYCKTFGWDLMGAFEEKMLYNSKREDHKHEARKAKHGKKF